MKRKERTWHPVFQYYMKKIVKHPAYSNMPEPYKDNSSIRWVVSANSEIGKKRRLWWERKRNSLQINPHKGDLAITALRNHPFGAKPCQICGQIMKLGYVYPNKNTLNKIHSIPKLNLKFIELNEISEIISSIVDKLGNDAYSKLAGIFEIPNSITKDKNSYSKYVTDTCRTRLSPGAMSDAPDRFDGFHTYNKCCRHIQDTGRHADNLAKYGQDRRLFEFWADGDWKAADWLMKEFNKHGLSPDHIGPISQGFCHRPKFGPTTIEENINKRDRLGLKDIQLLLSDEKKGEQVVSWHSKFVWDKLKHLPKSNYEAESLGKLMRKNLHNVLYVLYLIKKNGFSEFLVKNFLHPEYAYYSISFKKFDKKTGSFEMEKTKGIMKQYENNDKRYIRKSLEALDEYQEKENRKVKLWRGKDINKTITEILDLLKKGKNREAKEKLDELLKIYSKYAEREYAES